MTNAQKFILVLENDSLLQKDCFYLRKKWKFNNPIELDKFLSVEKITDMPEEYLDDLNFILMHLELPERFLLDLHTYLLKNKVPQITDLLSKDKKVEIFLRHDPMYNSGSVILKLDRDATKDDVVAIWKEVEATQGFLKESSDSRKKFQPSRNFEILRLLIKECLSPSDAAVNDATLWEDKDNASKNIRAKRRALKAQVYRYKKELEEIQQRPSVKDRKSVV